MSMRPELLCGLLSDIVCSHPGRCQSSYGCWANTETWCLVLDSPTKRTSSTGGSLDVKSQRTEVLR